MLVCRVHAINLLAGSQINDTIPKAAGRHPCGGIFIAFCETCTMQSLLLCAARNNIDF